MSNTKQKKIKYYSSNKIRALDCIYNLIIGERSNGKTYDLLKHGIENYINGKGQMAYVRRYGEDFVGRLGTQLFENLVDNNVISELTNGKYTSVKYYSSRWYLANYDEELDKLIPSEEPFCFGFALSKYEHYKSTAYPNIRTIVFDEFLTKSIYLKDEFVIYMNMISTIIRLRTDVKIYMLANTVNKYAPYFKEMGIKHIAEMKQGTIDVYTYGTSGLKVAVEYCEQMDKESKSSNKYFAFDNPSLQMITGGAWEVDLYPHCPIKYNNNNIMFIFFIDFNGWLLQGEVISVGVSTFLYFHEKTTPIHNEDTDIIFSERYDARPNWFRNIRKGSRDIEKKLAWFFKNDKVFYQDNEVGEIVSNYLKWCLT